jgi:phosphoribosyl 1,2-cyclic phosphodiesterase
MTTTCDPLTLTVLASGSSGNASVVHGSGQTVLLDAGISARRITFALDDAGLDAAALDAVFITHEHGDHVRGLRVLARRLGVPAYMTQGTLRACRDDLSQLDVHVVAAGDEVALGALGVRVFSAEHDAAEPVGFAFEDARGHSIGVVTDTGRLTDDAADALAGCEVLGVECNHDVECLENGPYPWFLKQRIGSDRGHLSNDAAASAVARLACDRLAHVVGLHLSNTNNSPELAAKAVGSALVECGIEARAAVFEQGSKAAYVVCTV